MRQAARAAFAYFALFTWLLKGPAPGKWLLGVRVVRLDGRPLTLWDAFGRTGGYSASLSTLGLGFVEALWNPNRQTMHDRISGTVVVRCPRRRERADSEATTAGVDGSADVDGSGDCE